MSLTLIVGYVGGGKTAFQTKLLQEWAKHDTIKKTGVNYYANYSINLDFKHKKKKHKVNVTYFNTMDELLQIPRGSVIAIDEASVYLSSRKWKDTDGRFLSLLAQSRKVGIDIVATTQRYTSVDVEFREKCEYVYLAQKYCDGLFFKVDRIFFDPITGSYNKRDYHCMFTIFNRCFKSYDTLELVVNHNNSNVSAFTTPPLKAEPMNEPQKSIREIQRIEKEQSD